MAAPLPDVISSHNPSLKISPFWRFPPCSFVGFDCFSCNDNEEECKKNVPVALIGMHSCSLDAKTNMNLESQVVEMPAEAKQKSSDNRKKKSEPKAKKVKIEKKGKKANVPNLPKRPATAFFIFMSDFRMEFKEANPDSKDVKEVSKHGSEKWKFFTDEEKTPYLDKASEWKPATMTMTREGRCCCRECN